MQMDVIYLDYNASTACDPEALEAMLPWLGSECANPTSRSHGPGRAAFAALEDARAALARDLGAASPTEIVFTSGATEANNLALKGCARTLAERGRHLITQATEHASVLSPLDHLAATGWEVTVIGVNSEGRIDLDELKAAIRPNTVLISLMLANNETGTLQPVSEAAKIAHARGTLIHCDAAQGPGKVAVNVGDLDVDLLSVSAHKFYGPKGIGALYLRRQRPLLSPQPLLHGGDQEAGLRSGTVNLPGAVGMARALSIAVANLQAEAVRFAALRDRLERQITTRLPEVVKNGSAKHRVAGTSNLGFPDVDGNALLAALPDLALSPGSACNSTEAEPSHVLRAMGIKRQLAASSLRFSIGRLTTEAEVDRAAARVSEEVDRLRTADRKWRSRHR